MTDVEFEELVILYVSDNINHDLDRYSHRLIGEMRCSLADTGTGLADTIDELAEEWCNDNGIDPNEYYNEYTADDIFDHDKYDFDA